jgi:hypothetical protein
VVRYGWTVGIKDIREKKPAGGLKDAKPSGRILLSPETAEVVRKLARYQGLTLDRLVQAMLQDYVPRKFPQLELVLEPDDPDDEIEYRENVELEAGAKTGAQKRKRSKKR